MNHSKFAKAEMNKSKLSAPRRDGFVVDPPVGDVLWLCRTVKLLSGLVLLFMAALLLGTLLSAADFFAFILSTLSQAKAPAVTTAAMVDMISIAVNLIALIYVAKELLARIKTANTIVKDNQEV